VYAVQVSRRRVRHKSEKARRHAAPLYRAPAPPREIVREATRVERLAYTRTQAAEALGVSRSTFNRRILPLVETVEMPWGARLIPVDELQRMIADRRRPAREQAKPATSPGRPAMVASSIVERVRAERAAGRSLGQIARDLNAEQVPTAHGGAQWWPSTVRAVLRRAAP
jgi:recombinase